MIATLIANRPELHFGQGVLHGDLQCLHYDLVEVHKLSRQINEVMEFPKGLNVKQILEKSLETGLYSSVWTLKINNFRPQEFL
jgi:hypothetical protein